MKRIFTFLFSFMCVLAVNAQESGDMVANFDDVVPSDVSSGGGLTVGYAQAPDGSLASGQMLVIGNVPAGNPGGSFTITLADMTFDPHTYVGLSFVAQVPEGASPAFILKLNQSTDPNHDYMIQDWATYPRYTGGGDWQEVHIPFDVVIASLDANSSFPVDQYNQIELSPGPWDGQPAFTVNMDNVMLRTSWDSSTGIPLTKAAAFILNVENGTISVVGGNGNPVSLKVYSPSGQEVAYGVNQVQVETKGIYIVKATNGNASSVSKIVVR